MNSKNNIDYADFALRMFKAGIKISTRSDSSGQHITLKTEKLGFYTDAQKSLDKQAQQFINNLERW